MTSTAASLNPEGAIAQVQAQAQAQQSGVNEPATSDLIATTSHYSSMAVGAGIAAQGGWVGLAAFAAGVGGGMAGAWVSDKLGAAEVVAKGLQAVGMRRVGAGGPHPATVGKQVAHSFAAAGFLASIVVGALAAVAVGALIVATGGMAAVAIIGAAAAGGFAGGLLGGAVGGALSSMGAKTGAIATGSPDVFIEALPAARVTDTAPCAKESGAPSPIVEGSETIFVNGLPLARIGHKLLCGAVVDEGATSVFTDSTTTAIATPAPDIPLWARVAADWVGFLPMGKLAAVMGRKTNSAAARGKAACNTTCAADPVDVATGAFVDWRTDLTIPGVLPVTLKRRYNSQAGMAPGFFGPRWRDSWHVQLRRTSAQASTIDYHDDEGVVLTFNTPYETLEANHLRAPQLVLQGSRGWPVLHDAQTGIRQHFEWVNDQCARLVACSDAHGNRCDFIHHRGDGRLHTVRHSDGWHLQLHWDRSANAAAGCMTSIWLHEPDRPPVALVRYTHDEQGRLTHSASVDSGKLRYTYDDEHRVVGWGDASHTWVHLQHDKVGRVHEVRTTGAEVHSGRFVYHPEQRITEVWAIETDAQGQPVLGARRQYQYNEDGLVTRERDALGRVNTTHWDTHHRVTGRMDALGRVTRYQYNDDGLLQAVESADGRSTRFVHDVQRRMIKMTDAAGVQHIFSYGRTGLLRARTEGALRWTFGYDALGHLLETQAPDGTIDRHHWDVLHRPCGHTDAKGGHTTWQQDRLGRLDWLTDAAGATTRYGYEQATTPRAGGHTQPTRITRADSSTEQIHFDAEGLPCSHTDAAGHTQRWQWGAFDLLAAHTDALGHTTTFHWGSEGRLCGLVNAKGQTWRWTYDGAGQCVAQSDYAGRVTRWQHDAAGRIQQRQTPDGATLCYHWDDADRLTAIHARGPDGADQFHLRYHHDATDKVICARVWQLSPRVSLLQSELRMAYDAAGHLRDEQHTDDTGRTRRISWQYDAAGRVTGRDAGLGQTRLTCDAMGLLAQWQSAHGVVLLQRDALGQEVERQGYAPPVAADDTWTPGIWPPGAGASHPAAVPGLVLQQRYDPVGRLLAQQQRPVLPGPAHGAPAVQRQYRWQADRLVGVDDLHFGRARWQLDARNQIHETQFEPPVNASGAPNLALREHPASALASPASAVRRSPMRQQFDYDANGNLARQDGVRLRCDGDAVVEHGPLRYLWDACGRLVRRTEHRAGWRPRVWHYQWDALDRLTSVHTPDGQRWRYVYDAFGRRRTKRCDKSSTTAAPSTPPTAAITLLRAWRDQAKPHRQLQCADYSWDGPRLATQWKLYADGRCALPDGDSPDPDAEDVQEWHFEPHTFKPLAVVDKRSGEAPRLLHVVADINGAPRELLDNTGQLVWAGQLDTWGHLQRALVRDRTDSALAPGPWQLAANDPEVDIDLRQANQWADEESGLLYNLHRHYDPDLGQYASLDPLGPIVGGWRTRGYVHNPATWVDPLGLTGCPSINVKHIFHGEVNKHGNAVGFHHNGSIGSARSARITSIVDPPNAQGVYRARIEVFDAGSGTWLPKGSTSTMFPDSFSRARVLSEVRGAFGNQVVSNGRYFEGLSPSGLRIGGYLDGLGNIATAFPIY